MTHGNGREPLQVILEADGVNINGVKYKPSQQTRKKGFFVFEGVKYETIEELWVAKMLTWMKIPFFHHVVFSFFLHPDDEKETLWCPDFVLGDPHRWVGPRCNGSVIVGLEVKKRKTNGHARRRSKALLREKGIPILLVSRRDIKPFFRRDCMELPLRPIKRGKKVA
ncbi:MAG: hypothetical protein ABIH38_02285 [Patescibacteria group bacterium]